jgi:hypothetical protein
LPRGKVDRPKRDPSVCELQGCTPRNDPWFRDIIRSYPKIADFRHDTRSLEITVRRNAHWVWGCDAVVVEWENRGISGILDNTVRAVFGPKGWRIAFLIGLVLPAVIFGLGSIEFAQGLPLLAFAGLLVGVGTRLGSGCTSGHGVCGLANFSPRSLVATSCFMIAAAITVFLIRHGELTWHS